MSGARAHKPDATLKAASEDSHSLPAPMRRVIQPHIGSVAAMASRYALWTHWAAASEVSRSAPMAARPRLTMEVSRPASTPPTARITARRHIHPGTASLAVRPAFEVSARTGSPRLGVGLPMLAVQRWISNAGLCLLCEQRHDAA